MYAFRKPFTVATFENMVFFGLDYKIILIIAQVLGYALSKFIGIKLISELSSNKRLVYLLLMIGLAQMSLILFGWIPAPYNTIFMFMNGLSLGMVWGVVFSYLEGRRFTEILGVALCSSFILSSGAVKSVGLLIMNRCQISELWMPAATGAIFLIPFFVCAFFLNQIPPPSEADITLKANRKPMTADDRKKVLTKFRFPMLILILFYVALTALRDFRDNFSREIWDAVGYQDSASIFTLSELPIAIFVLLVMASMVFIKQNERAFKYYHYLLIFGASIVGLSSFFFQAGALNPMSWMILVGFGLYLCYVPFNGLFFDRMIATFRINGNSGFLIYVADAFGYLGSIGVLLYKNFGESHISWLQFFISSTYILSISGVFFTLASLLYFNRKYEVTRHSAPMKIVEQ
jgi:MFS family permease